MVQCYCTSLFLITNFWEHYCHVGGIMFVSQWLESCNETRHGHRHVHGLVATYQICSTASVGHWSWLYWTFCLIAVAPLLNAFSCISLLIITCIFPIVFSYIFTLTWSSLVILLTCFVMFIALVREIFNTHKMHWLNIVMIWLFVRMFPRKWLPSVRLVLKRWRKWLKLEKGKILCVLPY